MSIEVTGLDTAVMRLLALPEKLRKTVQRQAMTEANQLIADTMRNNAPADSGTLKRSITSAVRRYKNGQIVLGIVGPDYNFAGNIVTDKKGNKKFKKAKKGSVPTGFRRPAKYAHLVEKGTVKRTTKSGQNRGSVPANPFVQRSAQQIEAQVRTIFENAVKAAVEN